ncbi:MAG: glycosyltransferase [Rikenellaceae bacterium]
MNIMHYTLGLSPERSGGLTTYATDLMVEQSKAHRVALLYPSGYVPFSVEISLRRCANYKNIECYKLMNSLPVPLLYGIKNPSDFISRRTMSLPQMELLYNSVKPHIFHVHTLMGLPLELLEYLKGEGVKLVFTSHDYFGICPKVNLIGRDKMPCVARSATKCRECNASSVSTTMLRVRNSRLFLRLCRAIKSF